MVADHWFMQVEKVLKAMEITSDTTRIKLDAFQLEGEGPSVVELGEDLWVHRGNDMGRVPMSCSWASIFRPLLDTQRAQEFLELR